jgi:hypothetical protein
MGGIMIVGMMVSALKGILLLRVRFQAHLQFKSQKILQSVQSMEGMDQPWQDSTFRMLEGSLRTS